MIDAHLDCQHMLTGTLPASTHVGLYEAQFHRQHIKVCVGHAHFHRQHMTYEAHLDCQHTCRSVVTLTLKILNEQVSQAVLAKCTASVVHCVRPALYKKYSLEMRA